MKTNALGPRLALPLVLLASPLLAQQPPAEPPRANEPPGTPPVGDGVAAPSPAVVSPDAVSPDAGSPNAESADAEVPRIADFEPGEVTVRASRPAVIDRATMQVVIGAEDIEVHRDRSLADTLSLVPGIATHQHGEGHIRFRMYGFEMPYVALLVDGIPIADICEANVDISKLPVLNVSKIVVDRGTASALYGSNATVGSINIVTMTPIVLYASAQSEVDTTGSYSVRLAHGDVHGKLFYWVTGTVQTQQPFTVSRRLHREFWLDRAMPRGLGYTVDRSSATAQRYLDTDEWPHQEGVLYAGSGRVGYRLSHELETGVSLNYSKSEAKRYSLTANTTEEFSQGA